MAAKQLREGVTTGTCATAAAMASALWQTDGKCPEAVAAVISSAGYVAVCWLFLYFLYRKNVFLKV